MALVSGWITFGSSQVCEKCQLRTELTAANGGVRCAYLWEGTVVPEVSLVWEAVADKAELALLGILEDWVEGVLLGDL